MCKNEEILEKIKKSCKAKRLTWADTAIGISVSNGKDNFLIKLNKKHTGVRKLYHQNHSRNSYANIAPNPQTIDNDYLQANYHHQEWDDSNIEHCLEYIRNHGISRRVISKQKRSIEMLISQERVWA